MDKPSVLQVGGSIERAVKGEYSLNLAAIFKEAWQKTLDGRNSINIALLMTYVIGGGVAFAVGEYFGGLVNLLSQISITHQELNISDDVAQKLQLIFSVVGIIQCPLFAGVDMLGVLHSVGIKTKGSMIFGFFKRSSWVILCSILGSILIQLGMIFILPGIFLAVSLTLVMPLVLDKKLSPMRAIIVCVQATRFQWFKIAGLYLYLSLLLVASCLPYFLLAGSGAAIVGLVLFIFAFSYIAPLFINIKGVLYREIFGVQLQSKASGHSSSDDVFIA